MLRSETDTIPAEHDVCNRELRSNERTCEITVEKALALAHSLLQAKRYQAAMRICKVASVDSHHPEVAILLACCEAGLKDYAACQKTLQVVFSGDNEALAAHLQAAFIYHDLGMNLDAINELITLTNDYPDLAMAWLLLGDRLHDIGQHDKAALCWRLAIDRDKRRGVAALAARRELAGSERLGVPIRRYFARPANASHDQS